MAVDDLAVMIGRSLLVGITYVDAQDVVCDQVQFAGVVTAVAPLVEIDCGTEEPFTLPPEPDAFDVGTPGEYRLQSTGEVVLDPDFVTM